MKNKPPKRVQPRAKNGEYRALPALPLIPPTPQIINLTKLKVTHGEFDIEAGIEYTNPMNKNKSNLPVWLLDIDGVLNSMSGVPNPKSLRLGTTKQEYLKTDSGTYRLRVDNHLVDFVNRMNDSDLVEVRWCTTWSDEANTVFAPAFGFPQLLVGARPPKDTGRFDDYNWKSNAARRVLESGRRLVWTDDDAIPESFDEEVASHSKGHLLVRPNPETGLTLADCEAIETFLLNN